MYRVFSKMVEHCFMSKMEWIASFIETPVKHIIAYTIIYKNLATIIDFIKLMSSWLYNDDYLV